MNRKQLEARFASLLRDAEEKAPPAFIAGGTALVALCGDKSDREFLAGVLSRYSREDCVKAVEVLESIPADTESVKDAIGKGINFINAYLLGVSVSE